MDLDRGTEGRDAMAGLGLATVDHGALVDLDCGTDGRRAMACLGHGAVDNGALVDLDRGAMAGQGRQSFHQQMPVLLEGLWWMTPTRKACGSCRHL